MNIEFQKHDMKDILYENGFFDGVICIWAIDLGTLSEIRQSIEEIHRVLRQGGSLITDFTSIRDETWGKGKEIERNTFKGAMKSLPDLIEHYTTKDELVTLFSGYNEVNIEESDHSYIDESRQCHIIKALDVEAIK